ncbi:ENTH/ANTH/VHS superfamily protein [Tasmannia lanceolata]|uniref:ENTH/ANTH/VHS superfamily protein n=1 Tax=Tasmannia lanceolata TaxID=3420 RepID=UPI004063FB83
MKMKMVVDVRSKLRLALGSVKDHAAIGKAMISSGDIFSNIEIAIVRATGHDNSPIDEKYVHEILFLVSNSPGSVAFLADKISRRLSKTRDRIVTLKTLLLVHRLMRGGDRNFEQDLRNARLSCDLRLNLYWFSKNSDILIIFLNNYVAFIEERMEWVINQAGKLEPIMPERSGFRIHREKSIEIVFYRLPRCQAFLDRIMDCLPIEISCSDSLTRAALSNILRESFQVYMSFCEGVTTLVDSFFDFKKVDRTLALNIFKRASSQSYKLFEFFENCKRITGSKSLDYPMVRIITADCISTMEEFLVSPQAFGNVPLLSATYPSSPTSILTNQSVIVRSKEENKGEMEERFGYSGTLFPFKLETKISTVWVEFDEEDSQNSCFSVDWFDDRYVGVSDDQQFIWSDGAKIGQKENLQLLSL